MACSKFFDALILATKAHQGQKRKLSNDPYVVHPIRVAQLIEKYYPESINLSIAALLHDLLEDTFVTKEEILDQFGEEVLQLVLDVTNDPQEITVFTKKVYQAKKIKELYEKGRIESIVLKLCDRLDNLRDCQDNKPFFQRTWENTYPILDYLTQHCSDLFVRRIVLDIKTCNW